MRNGIEEARVRSNCSKVDLSKKLSVSVFIIETWEMGTSLPPLNVLVQLMKIFNVSSEKLLFNEERAPLNISGMNDRQKKLVRELYSEIIQE